RRRRPTRWPPPRPCPGESAENRGSLPRTTDRTESAAAGPRRHLHDLDGPRSVPCHLWDELVAQPAGHLAPTALRRGARVPPPHPRRAHGIACRLPPERSSPSSSPPPCPRRRPGLGSWDGAEMRRHLVQPFEPNPCTSYTRRHRQSRHAIEQMF